MLKIDVLDKNNIKYEVRKQKRKSLTLSYDQKGVLLVKQPFFVSNDFVIDYINKHMDWIMKNKPLFELPHETYNDYDTYLILGKKYSLRICFNNYEEVKLIDNLLYVYTYDNHRVEKLLCNYRKNLAEDIFNEVLYNCFKEMESELKFYPKLIIKNPKSFWGLCQYKKETIELNVSLIHTPPELIKYVIFHELCHFLYPNHSKDFHNHLQIYVPNEYKCRKLLKNYSTLYK